MARIVKEHEYTARRNAILDAARRAIATTGYERMAIANLLDELQISSGAFYHYFDSKSALLFAVVERMGDEAIKLALPIVNDSSAGAIDKLNRFFAVLDRAKLANKEFILAYLRVWYADENAIVRHKLYLERVKRLTPFIEQIIRQGVEEGVFTTPYPDHAARIIISLTEDFGYATIDQLLATEHKPSDLPQFMRIIDAWMDAMERVIGAPAGCLQRPSFDELSQWLPPTSAKKEEANGSTIVSFSSTV